MARRVCWWIAVLGVPKDKIVAFTFTERAAEEMKFRIRRQIQTVTPPETEATLGNMYVGIIHGYCLRLLRELKPDKYYSFDVLDEGARVGLVQRAYHHTLGLKAFEQACGKGQYATTEYFLKAYDLLNEYAQLDVELAAGPVPHISGTESEWVKKAVLKTRSEHRRRQRRLPYVPQDFMPTSIAGGSWISALPNPNSSEQRKSHSSGHS